MVDINTLAADVDAIEQELGTNPNGIYGSVRARLDILEARINNPLAPSPDVEDPFIIGDDGITISTGLGAPTANRINGSIYLRQDGYNNQEIYSRQNSQWVIVASESLVFASTSLMSLFDITNIADGTEVTVAPPRAMSCVLDKTSTITPDNLKYFSASPSGI